MNFVSYFVIGIPIGVALGFKANMNLLGVWLGMTVGNIIHVSLFSGTRQTINRFYSLFSV